MRKCYLMMVAVLLTAGATTASAQIARNGKPVKKVLFDRENVTVVYVDGTRDEHVASEHIVRNHWSPTDLKTVEAPDEASKQKNGTYDLQGRRVESGQLPKGVYIERRNGKVFKTVKK